MSQPSCSTAALPSSARTQTGQSTTKGRYANTGLPDGEPLLQTVPNGVESTYPPRPDGQAFLSHTEGKEHASDLLPSDPAYLPQALLRFAPQMDRIGLPQDQREPFLRDLTTLVASALDALYPTSFADAETDVDAEPYA